METGTQEYPVNKKLLALVGVVLALVLVAICYVSFLLIRSKLTPQPAQPQIVQPEIPLPTPVRPVETVVVLLPAIENEPAPAVAVNVSTPVLTTTWRFLSINKKDVGTFENVGDPAQRLVAKCKDPNRPAPDAGAIYNLNDSGILKPQEGKNKFQRFEVITGN